MTNAEKIQTILRSELATWKTLSKEKLLELMIEERKYCLETEVEYGNEEYLDELIEEIDIEAVWALQHPEGK
jgi:hypothetical protein